MATTESTEIDDTSRGAARRRGEAARADGAGRRGEAARANGAGRGGEPVARVDIVVPVHNEQATLEASVRRLHDRVRRELPFECRIVIADNGSADGTPRIAAGLAEDLEGVEVLTLAEKGRGRALRAAWQRDGWATSPCSTASAPLVRPRVSA